MVMHPSFQSRSFSGAQVRQVAAKDEGIGLVAMPEGLNGKMPCLGGAKG